MFTLNDLPISLTLRDTLKRGNCEIRNAKNILGGTWKRSKRRIGGDWIGTAEWNGPRDELTEMFMEGIMREIRETVGNLPTWRGFCGEMSLFLDGVEYRRNWGDISNGVKIIYSRLGDNLFTNGSAESAAWAAYNGGVSTQSTTWVTDGIYSDHIVAAVYHDGATIQTGMSITAGISYQVTLPVKIVTGSWKVWVYRTDTMAGIASTTETATGQNTIRVSISDTNTYTGSLIAVSLLCESSSGEMYGDGAIFQESPRRAETGWYRDTSSETEFGTMELEILESGMSDDSANAMAQTRLAETKLARSMPPEDFSIMDVEPGKDKLELTFYGYSYTTRNKYSTITGSLGASAHVSNILGACEFVTAGIVTANTMTYQIEDRAPFRHWEILKSIAEKGDIAGALWQCGCNGSTAFDYTPFPTTYDSMYQNGRLLNRAGGEMEPWFMVPGLIYIRDLPTGPGSIGGQIHDPHIVVAEEIEFDAAEWMASGNGMSFKRRAS